ncbi:uncharacterized protein LOC122547997 [Chiloscyllium plagiosum]|uniref:uncharacterized protein LOC122547997 n=1 Tax=Chiloscyllium plagiosum TaxID=36176 RepID=UPI001CB7C52F|nr:uncharacterized protein LOC122547997 [Chiloscyllium plagiosum]
MCFKSATITSMLKKSLMSCLNDYCPVALTRIITKCFERRMMSHIKTLLPSSLDTLQFMCRPNYSTDNAIFATLHLALTHPEKKDTYIRLPSTGFSSALNTVIPLHLFGKLGLLGLNISPCNWILEFLTRRTQFIRIGNNISNTPGLCAQFTAVHSADTQLCNDADALAVVGLISIQRGGAAANGLVQSQQPDSDCGQDKRDGC